MYKPNEYYFPYRTNQTGNRFINKNNIKNEPKSITIFILMYCMRHIIDMQDLNTREKTRRLQENCASDEKMSINNILLYDFV